MPVWEKMDPGDAEKLRRIGPRGIGHVVLCIMGSRGLSGFLAVRVNSLSEYTEYGMVNISAIG